MRRFVKDISAKDFDKFNVLVNSNHYVKMSSYGQFKALEGFKYRLVAIEEDGVIIATALVLIKKIPYLFSNYCYIPYGYNLDYKDQSLINFFNESIKVFSQELNACFVRVDPNFCRLQHEKDGTITENGYDNQWFKDLMLKDGFMHLGYNYGYSGNWLSRFSYILDLSADIDKIKKNIKNFNNHDRKNKMRAINVYLASKKDLDILYQLQLELAQKERFVPKPLSYFQQLYDSFKDNVYLYIAKADLEKCYQNLQEEKNRIEDQIIQLTNTNRIKELSLSVESLNNEMKIMKERGYDKVSEIILGAKLIIQIDAKVFNVYMYTHKFLPNFRTALALHTKTLEDSKKRNALSYDFEGVSGSLDPKDAYYGIHDFKRSFGGDFVEYFGEFDLVLDERRYLLFKKFDRLIKRYRRKVYLFFKGW